MVEVFITDIQDEIQAEGVLRSIKSKNPELKIHYDLNETKLPFPCGHTVLRLEGENINSENILGIIKTSGFHCQILEDKVCIKPPQP